MVSLQRSTTIDWVAATVEESATNHQHLATIASRLVPLVAGDWFTTKPRHGYTRAVRNADGVIAMSGEKRMGTHLIASGSALTALRNKGMPTAEFVSHLLVSNARFARIDLALDAIGSKINFLSSFRAIERGVAETSARTWLLVQSGDNGWTLYVGSRSSDHFFRMYNKYAEVKRKAKVPQGTEDWTRFELACSNEVSRQAGRCVEQFGQDVAVRSFIRGFIFLPGDRHWVTALSGKTVDVGASPRRLTDTESWLLGPCAATLARESIVKPELLESFRSRVNSERDRLLIEQQLSKDK